MSDDRIPPHRRPERDIYRCSFCGVSCGADDFFAGTGARTSASRASNCSTSSSRTVATRGKRKKSPREPQKRGNAMHDEVTDPWELAIERIRSDPNFSVEAKRALIARTLSKRDGREVSPDEVVLPDGPVVDADPQ